MDAQPPEANSNQPPPEMSETPNAPTIDDADASGRPAAASSTARAPEVVIETNGGACPTQAEGTINGIPFYFRARSGVWDFTIGSDPVGQQIHGGADYDVSGDDDTYGWMKPAEVEAIIREHAAMFARR